MRGRGGSCWWENTTGKTDAELMAHAVTDHQDPTQLFRTADYEDGDDEYSAVGFLLLGATFDEWHRYTKPLRELIRRGANLDAICTKSRTGGIQTPLDFAFVEGDVELFSFLIENGATPKRAQYGVDMFDEVVSCNALKQMCLISVAWSLLQIRQDDDLI